MTAWLAVEIWAGRRAPAILIPEGGDDVELRGEETSFVQVKSRREHLGDYTEGETAGHIEDLWSRSLGSSPQPERLGLVLERNVAGLAPLEERPTIRAIEGPITARLSKFGGASDLLPKTSIIVATSPQEWAISLIADRLNCSPIAAQMCFAELLVRVGALQRKTRGDRMRAKLQDIKVELQRRMHWPISEQGEWLRQVVIGHFAYFAVPTNIRALTAFRLCVTNLWRRSLERRGQRSRLVWERLERISDDWLPIPRVLHPWPERRFAVNHPR